MAGDEELTALAHAAGFESATTVLRDLEPHAREVGIPEDHLPMFAGSRQQFLIAVPNRTCDP